MSKSIFVMHVYKLFYFPASFAKHYNLNNTLIFHISRLNDFAIKLFRRSDKINVGLTGHFHFPQNKFARRALKM